MEEFKPKKEEELITFCAWCNRRKEGEEWKTITAEEKTALEKTDTATHGICPECSREMQNRV